MRTKKILPLLILLGVCALFFYKTIFLSLVPFPGDLLIAEYSPWKYETYMGYNPGSYPNKAQYFDVLRQLYPWKMFAVAQIKKGEFPLWNPHNFSGSPFFANNQSAVLNPFNVVFFVLNPAVSWSIFIMLQPFLASVFTYLYLRKINLSIPASLLGALAFSYSLFMSVFLEYGNFGHTILWFPFILYFIEKIIKKKDWSGILGLTIGIGLMFFAGHLQLAVGTFLFSLIYILVRLMLTKNKRLGLTFVACIVLGIGIASVQLFPTMELINNSARVSHDLETISQNFLVQINQLIVFFTPDFYGNPSVKNYLLSDSYPTNALYIGILPLLFVMFALPKVRTNVFILFFAIASAVLLVMFTNNPLSVLFYKLNLPFVSGSSPSNLIFLLSFSLSVLSAFGLDEFKKISNTKALKLFVIYASLFAILYVLNAMFGIKFYNKQILLTLALVFVSVGIIFVYLKTRRQVLLFSFVLLTVFDLFYFFQKFNPFVPQQFLYPQTAIEEMFRPDDKIARSIGFNQANIEPNFQTHLSFYSPEGYDPLYPRWYGELLYSVRNGKLLEGFDMTTRSDAKVVAFPDKKTMLILNTLGVKYVFDRFETGFSDREFFPENFSLLTDKNGWKIYENRQVLPRVYLTGSYFVYGTKEEFSKKFFDVDRDARTIFLEQKPGFESNRVGGEAKIAEYSPDRIKITTESKENTLLSISDTYYPGWEATVDKKQSKIMRANHAFRAVEVPKGQHVVEFKYNPYPFQLGLKISIISLMLLVMFSARSYFYEK